MEILLRAERSNLRPCYAPVVVSYKINGQSRALSTNYLYKKGRKRPTRSEHERAVTSSPVFLALPRIIENAGRRGGYHRVYAHPLQL